MHKLEIKSFWDFFRCLLVITGTVAVTYFLWTRVNWLLAYIFIVPVYYMMRHLLEVLIQYIYYRRPEYKVASNAMNALHRGDIDIALRIAKDYEKHKTTSSENDSKETATESCVEED